MLLISLCKSKIWLFDLVETQLTEWTCYEFIIYWNYLVKTLVKSLL